MTHVDAPPASPCVKVCRINPDNGLCCGCLRTVDEISAWSGASAAQKRAILGRVARRRANLSLRGPTACNDCLKPCNRAADADTPGDPDAPPALQP
ncbi:MAG: DUF1289 domain-containing protein [Betaproteobacteria bacterium]|nr:DUF1289 domain-containing protein [Betaproteobacteria bacterium]